MIQLVELSQIEKLEKVCPYSPALGTQIYADFQLYQNRYSFCNTWLVSRQGEPVGAVSRFYHSFRAVVQGEGELEELFALLEMLGAREIILDQPYAGLLYKKWGGSLYSSCTMIRREKAPLPLSVEEGFAVEESQSLETIYQILQKGYPYFAAHTNHDRWYCDTSHRVRHEGAKIWTVWREEQENREPAATGGIYALSPFYAVLGGVSTRPEFLHRGYASAVAARCVNWALEQGKTPVLMCSEPGLVRLYEKLGFTVWGEWGSLSQEKEKESEACLQTAES